MAIDWAEFDAGLDEYQATLYEHAADAAERSYETAARPDAEPVEVTFGDLRVGDYMTNEGPRGRWVRVVEIRGSFCYVKSRHQGVADGEVSVLFEIPEAVHVSGETRYWLDRRRDEPVLIDWRARASG
jgi:hypothetical protein